MKRPTARLLDGSERQPYRRTLRVGDKVCRVDDPTHIGVLEAMNRYSGRCKVRWYPHRHTEYLDTNEVDLAPTAQTSAGSGAGSS